MQPDKQRAWLSWMFVGALAVLSITLGLMQYRWIGEVSRAERERLRGSLQASLQRISQDFNWELASACTALIPKESGSASDERARENEYAARFLQAHESGGHSRMVKAIFLAVPAGGSLEFRKLDAAGRFATADWPADWTALRERLESRLTGDFRRGPIGAVDHYPDLFEIPRFGAPPPGAPFPRETEWLVVQLDLDYLRSVVIPELLQRDLGSSATGDYQVEIVMADDPSHLIFASNSEGHGRIGKNADASVHLFEVRRDLGLRRQDRSGKPGPTPATTISDRGRFLLSVRHRAGSLEAVVQRARLRNLAVTTGLLLLLLAAVAALVRFTRRAQRLAELQMEFVSGVSHELRTPLSVMRTAGHNLRGRVAHDPVRVQRYGELIEEESEKLAAIVEQVLQFGNANAGRVIGTPEPVALPALLHETVQAARKPIEESGCYLETDIDDRLPLVLGDGTALKHVFQNLIGNAVKYGKSGQWIGVFASLASRGSEPVIEIRIADHGPGIPAQEVGQIFDPFYRGKKATEDQIHGTGLGLSLAKRIIEAHHGAITVRSEPGTLTEFVIRIPAAPAQHRHEFANLISRG